jgi:hypothetical protein
MQLGKHILFWTITGSILVTVFGSTYDDYVRSFYFVTFLLPVAMATSYFFNYHIVPQFLLKKKYARFTLYTIYTVIVSFYLEMVVITISFIVLANYNYGELSPIMTNVFVLGFSIYLIVLLKAFYLLYRRFTESEVRLNQLKKEKEALKTSFITVRADRSNHQIKLDDLIYLESLSDYVKIYFNEESLMTRETISSFEESLPETFVRIHRSYIVNLDYVTEFSSKSVTIGSTELPISRTYKEAALKHFSG